MRAEDALRRALTQATTAEHSAKSTANRDDRVRAEAFAHGARAALQWALGDSDIDPFGGVRIHELGEASFYRPSGPPVLVPVERATNTMMRQLAKVGSEYVVVDVTITPLDWKPSEPVVPDSPHAENDE